MKKILFLIHCSLLMAMSCFSVFGYFGSDSWILDLFSHFKVQYLIVLVLGTILLLVRKKRVGWFFLPFILLNGYEIQSLYHGGNKNSALIESTKIVGINLLGSNRQQKAVEQFIQTQSPDILILLEFNHHWYKMLDPRLKDYTYRLTIPRYDNFGIAVYSKTPFSQLRELTIGQAGAPSIIGDFQLNNKMVTLVATHTLPPTDHYYFEQRNIQLAEISDLIPEIGQDVVLIGDLNTSSFSNHFKNLIQVSQLIDSRKGFGTLPSWPTWFWPMSITLDHCMISPGIMVKNRSVGSYLGSDHLPIVMEINAP